VPGRKITNAAYKRLNDFGEENIFESYLSHRSVDHMLAALEPQIGQISHGMFYGWLRADKDNERWERWQVTKKIYGSSRAEEGLSIVDDADDGTVTSARLRSEYRRWMAERFNREEYGKPDANTTVNVVTIGSDFLEALKKVEEDSKKEIAEADFEILENTQDVE